MQQVNKLKALRKEEGYTMMEMAKDLGISEGYYSLLENQKRRMLLKYAFGISKKLNKPIEEIFSPNDLTQS